MNNLHTLIRSLVITLVFVAAPAFAIDESNVQLLAPAIYSSDQVELYANVNIGVDEEVVVWFEYGDDIEFLTQTTTEQTWRRGYNFMSETVDSLLPDTTYYFRAALMFEGEVFQTEPEYFRTLVSINLDDSGTDFEAMENEGIDVEVEPIGSGIKNPFDFFRRNRDKNDEGEVIEDDAEKKSVEYSDDPVGGVVNEDSVFFTDEDGEVIEYSDEYRNKFKQKKTGQGRGVIFFIIILLVGVIIWLIMKTRRRSQGAKPNTRRARIQRLNRYRHPQQYRAANDVHAPVTPARMPAASVPVAQPRFTDQAPTQPQSEPPVVSSSPPVPTKQPIGYQGSPTIQKQETQGTVFKAPPRNDV